MSIDAVALSLFREKARELEESALVKSVAGSKGLSTKLEARAGQSPTVESVGPGEDEIRSSVLTIRLFCQDNDRISIRNLAGVVGSLPIDQPIKDEFARHRADLNAYLDSPTSIGFDTGKGLLSRRELFLTFLYGFYAHLEDDKLARIMEWRKTPMFDDMKMEFGLILLRFTQLVARLSGVVENVQAALAPTGT